MMARQHLNVGWGKRGPWLIYWKVIPIFFWLFNWHSLLFYKGNLKKKHCFYILYQVLLFKSPIINTAAAKSLQSCPTLCDPIDDSPPGSPVPGILQARTLEWVAISFSSAWKWEVKVKSFSRVRLLATPWTAAYQAPLSMGFSRQEYWSGVPLPSLINTHTHTNTFIHTCDKNYSIWNSQKVQN